jgi:hypothetical protein
VGPRTGLDVFKKSRPHRDSIPGPSSPQSVAIPTPGYNMCQINQPSRGMQRLNNRPALLHRPHTSIIAIFVIHASPLLATAPLTLHSNANAFKLCPLTPTRQDATKGRRGAKYKPHYADAKCRKTPPRNLGYTLQHVEMSPVQGIPGKCCGLRRVCTGPPS